MAANSRADDSGAHISPLPPTTTEADDDDDSTPSKVDDWLADTAGAHDKPDVNREQPKATTMVIGGIVALAVLVGVVILGAGGGKVDGKRSAHTD
ncbi:hypothetical protein SPBR_01140 [Sporothrix brasiliensis 5110]|uniref:Uncharacterized protein n=1 Tax=Sporothrix brasiliensis 5110 TaxID=1398154 RepID=A0A0C2J007_9PEZI|nr:uncharacterized protein SPBR_01140 [Sporothrix brasiliensis 5110]KIH90537.1 hypothetical protein SPBR_01140 [Sporothrix brasiliensis 5110]